MEAPERSHSHMMIGSIIAAMASLMIADGARELEQKPVAGCLEDSP
jgi:hypothetical protein